LSRHDTSARVVWTGEPDARVDWPTTPLQLRYAEANAILRWKGDAAPVYVVERIGALATAGDAAGVERFREIARCMADLVGVDGATRQ